LDIIEIKSPDDLFAVVLHPHIEVKTADARAVLSKEIPLKDAITQTGNLGGFIAGLYTNDYYLMGRSLQDVIVEPKRKHLIPHFDKVKTAAIEHGALGSGISGAGPSIFALCKSEKTAEIVAENMKNAYENSGISFDTYVSKINPDGCKII